MADCEAMHTLILRAVDETLDPAGVAALSAHAAQCGRCRGALAAQRAVRRALADLPLTPVSADFAARVRERVSARWVDAFNWRAWTLRLAPVAALLALLAVLPLQQSPSSEGATSEAGQSLSSALDTWSASRAGAGAQAAAGSDTSPSQMQLLLNPEADPHALLEAALGETTR